MSRKVSRAKSHWPRRQEVCDGERGRGGLVVGKLLQNRRDLGERPFVLVETFRQRQEVAADADRFGNLRIGLVVGIDAAASVRRRRG